VAHRVRLWLQSGPEPDGAPRPEVATAQALCRINAQHINADKPWPTGIGAAAVLRSPTARTRENNLLGSRRIRYGGYGGIAYHHVADTYIALFTSFITCGVWEAVHILDALLKNRSEIQPDTLHADTQGQSEPVFGLCRLLGIKLMPRMRGLSDTMFYRPSNYRHVDALFGGEIDWDLIATHARDMFQVALSIRAGRVMPSMLLRKLGAYSRRNLLYRAFRELGWVERTLFLLRFVSSLEVRRTIRAETRGLQRLPRLGLLCVDVYQTPGWRLVSVAYRLPDRMLDADVANGRRNHGSGPLRSAQAYDALHRRVEDQSSQPNPWYRDRPRSDDSGSAARTFAKPQAQLRMHEKVLLVAVESLGVPRFGS
jgi:TnpA family transposase